MSTYKTPGVYVEEIVKFPPSVAQVETAIPAFIGYTEKATSKVKGDLNSVPTRISSMLEYETFFGKPEPETSIIVNVVNGVVSAKAPVAASKSKFLMYYSMQMYFANGGGPCYILSIGRYGDALLLDDVNGESAVSDVSFTTMVAALGIIRKVDEPTLLLFPDATSLGNAGDFYNLYNAALEQCKELQDRFTIIDTYSYDDSLPVDPNIAILRDGINSNKDEIKYGAAYYPFLKTILNYHYNETDIDVTISDAEPRNIQQEVLDIAGAIDTTTLTTLLTDINTLSLTVAAFVGPDVNDDAKAEIPNFIAKINAIKNYLTSLSIELNKALNIARAEGTAIAESNALDTWITDEIESLQVDLNRAIDRLNLDDSQSTVVNETSDSTTNTIALQRVLGTHNDSSDSIADKINDLITSELKDVSDNLPTSSTTLVVKKLNIVKNDNDQLYNQVKAEINNIPLILPPSSTIAGVYAKVDADRGVWKAPANIGLNYVIEPTMQVSHEDQQSLNVDVNSGKSINVIRAFTGKGNLVWGARTLAGNDNEWRYVSVRRFFNMAEESIKKATEQFVFEPNDRNTWVRVKAMIDNFLTLQWRAGALAGPTPESAFYVKVGLGVTMTAQDILEGNMILEIGMAVVRPAEFIILKFSHKMQEA